jgi:hypothetical protein
MSNGPVTLATGAARNAPPDAGHLARQTIERSVGSCARSVGRAFAIATVLCAAACSSVPNQGDVVQDSDAQEREGSVQDVPTATADALVDGASMGGQDGSDDVVQSGSDAEVDSATPDSFAPDAVASDARGADGGTRYGGPVHVGTLPAMGLPETSGIVASRAQPGVFWVENDSGNPAEISAIDAMGRRLATIRITGATNVDWEDISIDRRAGVEEIYIADTGDNLARQSNGAMGRANVRIYRIPEPIAARGDGTAVPERFDFTYPMRPYDCEAVFVDHRNGDVYFVTKENAPAQVFMARAPLNPNGTTMLTNVGTINMAIVTAADMSTDGSRVVVRGYTEVNVFSTAAGMTVAAALRGPFLSAIPAAAAEAIAFEYNGYGMYTVPEGNAARLYYIPWQ